MELPKKIEALLFISGEPISTKEIARLVDTNKETIEVALEDLTSSLKERGIRLLRHNDEIQLVTAPEASDLATKLAKERLEGELSRATLETLAVILWKGKVSRSSIDYIRGVNSSFALRTLLIRGLVEREHDPNDSRAFLYSPTMDLLKHIGISSVQDLPQYSVIQEALKEHD
ncbi:MAG: SMC-Scp complex subunit ScpB [Patescibacteria group bacterium]